MLDARTGQIVAKQTESTKPQRIQYNSEVTDALAAKDGKKYISVHNHPESMPPSLNDLNALYRNEKVEFGVIVGHDGAVYRYTKPKREISREAYEVAIAEYEKYSGYTAQLMAIENIKKNYGFEVKIWKG